MNIGSALDRGLAWLLATQDADGWWRDFLTLAGEGTEWPTAFVGHALGEAAPARTEGARARVVEALAAGQRSDGGWGYHGGVPTDADSTACALLCLASTDAPPDVIADAAGCLIAHQDRASGGVSTYARPGPIRAFMGVPEEVSLDGWCRPHLEVTATAGRALASAGRIEAARAAWRFVAARQREDGTWGSYWWAAPFYPTAQAMALALALPGEPGADKAVRAATAGLLARQRPDGGWGGSSDGAPGAFDTAVALRALVQAGAEEEPLERARVRLARMQLADGSWPSVPIMRIPRPWEAEPDRVERFIEGGLGTGVVIADHRRAFTTAACVAALAAGRP